MNKHFENYPLTFTEMDRIMMELVYDQCDEWENQVEQQLRLMPNK